MYNCIAYFYRLILIAEKETVYEKFPTPLINRLEKHFVLTKTILLDLQKEVLEILETWVGDFSEVSYSMSTRLVCICIILTDLQSYTDVCITCADLNC